MANSSIRRRADPRNLSLIRVSSALYLDKKITMLLAGCDFLANNELGLAPSYVT